MANEVTKTSGAVTLSKTQQFQVDLVNSIDKAASESGRSFTEYGKQCVINGIANLLTICKTQDVNFADIDQIMIKIALQNIGYTELNFAAIPSEAYFDLRKCNKDGKTTYAISVKPQGAGNEKLTRKYGVGLKKDTGLKSAWLIREGDEFTFPSFDGLNMNPPKWTPKSYDKKVMMVVYPAVKVDGTVEYLIATREGTKANIIAQIRQNALYKLHGNERDKLYSELNEDAERMTVDELLATPKWSAWVNPTYTSGGSKEAMLLRKMKNNALKNYPKEYGDQATADAVTQMFEDTDDSLNERPKAVEEVDVIDNVEREINEKPKTNAPQDFEVDENGVVEAKPVEAEKVPEPAPAPAPTPAKDNYDEEY